MTTTSSAATLAGYIHAMMGAFDPASAAGRSLAGWLRQHRFTIGIDFEPAALQGAPAGAAVQLPPADQPLPDWAWRSLRAALQAAAGAVSLLDDVISRNIAALAPVTGMSPVETAIFGFVFHAGRENGFDDLCHAIVWTGMVDSAGLVALAIGGRPADVAEALRRGPLATLRLIMITGDGARRFAYDVPERIRVALLPPNDGLADIERQLIGTPLQPGLAAEDFSHVSRERDFILRLLRGAVAARRRGVNILLYGAPGTGKTEFCKLVAAQLCCDLFAIGECDEYGGEPTRADRLDALRLAERLAGRRERAVLLFDEMEDVLQSGDRGWGGVRRAGSKVFFNRLLEDNQVPVLWTANTLCEFDPAFLRRMAFALEMPLPPAGVRARLWDGLARRHGLALPSGGALRLADRHKVAPSLMVSATAAVATAGGGADEIDFVVDALARPLTGRRRPPAAAASAGFDPALANADADLGALAAALARPGAPRDVTLCLYGPPGTGKSAFARRLAEGMGLDALLKRGSDLLSKWVGGTERLIAAAFEEAAVEGRFLIIDEAEGFLWNRGGASRSWEVSMVNELLVAMESHPLPFACTTNHLEQIDAAALRRFAFKVKFDYMTPAQTAAAYRRFFDRAPPPALRELTALTPGDFAAVARQLRYRGEDARADGVLLGLLEQEMAVKNLPRRIGF